MLVLSRKAGETIHIDGQIRIKIVTIDGKRVKVGIDAPEDIRVLRSELTEWSELSFERYRSSDSKIGPRCIASLPK